MTDKLKPCPFCGGEAVLDFVDDDAWYVHCIDYDGDCDMRPHTKSYETPEEAIEVWNRRANDE
ncbi:MAG: Lar family restriction alleviation protein [Synergistaceae bacterium]|nr:Lar family restriction alleviation protein [Synergistaceae bacterium]